METIRIIIVDDDPLIREGLKIIISHDRDFKVLATLENGQEAVRFCKENEVDVAVIDVRMPILNGVDATEQIVAQSNTRVLILSTFDSDDFILNAIKNGAKGYILKTSTPERIKEAIKVVSNGNVIMQDVVMLAYQKGVNAEKNTFNGQKIFSSREIEVMKLISLGKSNKEIAGSLFIAEGTVKNHITSILEKTHLEHRTQIAIYYINGGSFDKT